MSLSDDEHYRQIFEEHRFSSDFRIKILGAWGAVYAALAAIFAWVYSAAKPADWTIPLLAVVMTLLLWVGDRRNRTAIRRSKEVGAALEEHVSLPEARQFFSKLEYGFSHSAAIDMFAIVMIVVLSLASGFLLATGGKLPTQAELGSQITVPLWTGTVAGVVAAAIWAALVAAKRRWRHWHSFGRLAGRYTVTPKLAEQSDLGTGSTVRISVQRNILTARFDGLPAGEVITGEIAMNEEFTRSGQGHYEHLKSQQQLWGFWQLQVKDAHTLLVHNIYARRDAALITQGFVWRRLTAPAPFTDAA